MRLNRQWPLPLTTHRAAHMYAYTERPLFGRIVCRTRDGERALASTQLPVLSLTSARTLTSSATYFLACTSVRRGPAPRLPAAAARTSTLGAQPSLWRARSTVVTCAVAGSKMLANPASAGGMTESTDTNGPVSSGCVSTLGWAPAERRRVCSSLIIRIAVLSTATASITAISSQNSQAGQRWCSTICQLSPRGQQPARTH
jgi:hypothetical protein